MEFVGEIIKDEFFLSPSSRAKNFDQKQARVLLKSSDELFIQIF